MTRQDRYARCARAGRRDRITPGGQPSFESKAMFVGAFLFAAASASYVFRWAIGHGFEWLLSAALLLLLSGCCALAAYHVK